MRAYEIYKRSKKYCYHYGKEYDTFAVIFQTISQARIDNLRESLKGEVGIEIFSLAKLGGWKAKGTQYL